METESKFLIGWEEERAELRVELSRLKEELAESKAEKEELQSRTHALTDRLSQTVDMSLSLRLDGEQREWRRKLREGTEREGRQALLIHKLQNKLVEYRGLCGHLEQQVQTAERKRMLRDEHSDALESALIRLEEEQQRSVALVGVNTLLRSQLSQTTEANQALQGDLKKLTADWTKTVEEVGQREIDWHQEKQTLSRYVSGEHARLLLIWGGVEALRRQCHTIKTATDKDLWELRAEFSRLSSTLLSLPCLPAVSSTHASPPLSSTLTSQPLSSTHASSSTPGPMTVEDLRQEQTVHPELIAVREENSGLRYRSVQSPGTRCVIYTSSQFPFPQLHHIGIITYRVIVSLRLDGHSRNVASHVEPNDGLSSVLTIIAQAETALQWRHQELEEAEGNLRRLRVETESLEQRIKELCDEREEFQDQANQTALELKQTQRLLNSEKEIVDGLRRQLVEMETHSEELTKENKQLRFQREREDEERSESERERQRRVETELLENAQLCERESRTRLELHNLQGALERERLERERIEREATEIKDALVKTRESLVAMSSSYTLLKREAADGRDALEKTAALNESLARDKSSLNSRILQKVCVFRAHRDTELDSLQQVRLGERELQKELQALRGERDIETTALAEEKARNEELCEQHRAVCEELDNVKTDLCRIAEQEKELQRETHTHLKELRQLEETKHALERQNEELRQDREELRNLTETLQQQLCVAQDQASMLEVQCTQLNLQISTLLQAKDVLHGEIQCLHAELERDAVVRQQEKHVASEERRRCEKETEHCRAEVRRLRTESERTSEQLKIQELEQDEERGKWQQEREALNSELGQRDGEVEALKNRMEALVAQNRELSNMVDERNSELEQLQVELAGERRDLEMRLQQANEEMERWKTSTVDIQREKEELNQRVLQREEQTNAELEITRREKGHIASLLRQREIEIQKKDKDTEEFMLKVRLQEGVIEALNSQLKEKEVLERKLTALEEQGAQLKERESAKRQEEERRQQERVAEEREREVRIRGELREKEAALEQLKDQLEELLRDKKHICWMLEEKEGNLEKLQNNLTGEQKNLERIAREAKDEIERWKRRAGDAEKEKEVVNQMLADRVERERNDLSALEQEMDDLRNVLQEREEALQKRVNDIMDLKSTLELLEGIIENERKHKETLEGQLIMLGEQNSHLIKRDEERLKERNKMEDEHQEQQKVLCRELEQRDGEIENLRSKAEEILKEKDEILDRLDERDTELEKLKARLTKEQLTFEQRVKEDNEQREKWKMRIEELEKEIQRLEEREESWIRLEEEGQEREQEMRGEICRMGQELKQLRVKMAEMDGENREMQWKTVEQKERLECQAALLREREQDANRLRETLQQKEEDETKKAQQGQEDLRKLKERLTVMEQDLKDTQSLLDKEGHLRKEKEKELLSCSQKLQLANAKSAKEEEKVQDLEETSKRLMEEVEMLRGKLEERSGELERKLQLLQNHEREVKNLKIRLEEGKEENKGLRRSLSQKEGETEQFEIRLKVQSEKLRAKLEELQQEQHSLVKLETQVLELEEERDHLSSELRRKERDVELCKEETGREKQEKDIMSVSLKQKEEELKGAQEREEAVKIREGLKAGLQEMATLRELLEESHREGETLRAILQGKKGEMVRSKEKEDGTAARAETDLQARVQRIEKKNLDLQAQLLLRECELEKNVEAVTRERRMAEKREEDLRTLETIVKQKEDELARVKPKTNAMEEQRPDLIHVVAEKSKEVEKLTSRVKELEEVLKEKNQDLKNSEQVIGSLQKEKNYRQNELQEREKRFELLSKELREKEREIELIKNKMQVKERMNERVKYLEAQGVKNMEFAKEKLNEKETELEKVREIAFKEEKARVFLQKQLEDAMRNTKTLKCLLESQDKENEEKIARLERDIYHLRESEKNANKLKKKIYKQLHHHLKDVSGIGMICHTQTEMKDLLKKEDETDVLNSQMEALETDVENLQPHTDEEACIPQDDGVWELLNNRVCAVLLEKQETSRHLREKESEVYALKERTEELSRDRDRVRMALEKTELMLIHYKERLQQLDQEKTKTGRCGEEVEPSSAAEERLCAMQRAVAQLELQQRELQQRNRHLEQHIQRLKTERQHLRDTLKQVNQCMCVAGQSGSDELNSLRAHAGELAEQVHCLRLMLAASQEERTEFIDRSLMNSHRLLSLRQDLKRSLLLVTERMQPSVLQAETDRLDRSIREEELSFTLNQS
uniref:Si:dkey-230p4.1 n=1 Tax=Electrophorus electricus TaxID=8005 RepID=A0A4W4H5B0_ELEEL